MTITVGAVIVWLAPGSQKQRPLFILQHFLRFRSSKLDPQVFEGKKGLWKCSQKYSGGCLKTFLVLKLGTNIKYLVLNELQRVNIFNKEWGLVGVWACDLGQRAILKTVLFQPLWPCPVEGHEAEISHGTIKAFYLSPFWAPRLPAQCDKERCLDWTKGHIFYSLFGPIQVALCPAVV